MTQKSRGKAELGLNVSYIFRSKDLRGDGLSSSLSLSLSLYQYISRLMKIEKTRGRKTLLRFLPFSVGIHNFEGYTHVGD